MISVYKKHFKCLSFESIYRLDISDSTFSKSSLTRPSSHANMCVHVM